MQVNPESNPRYVRLRGMASVKEGWAGFRDVDVVMCMPTLYLYSTQDLLECLSVCLHACLSCSLPVCPNWEAVAVADVDVDGCRWKVVPVWWEEASYYGVLSGWGYDGGSFPDNDVRWCRVMG
jgi:hypothetical protein